MGGSSDEISYGEVEEFPLGESLGSEVGAEVASSNGMSGKNCLG